MQHITPDDSTQVHLDEVKAATEVVLSKENAERLILAIQKLGKSNLRLADEFRSVKRIIWVVLLSMAILMLALVMLTIMTFHVHETLAEVVKRQEVNVMAISNLTKQVGNVDKSVNDAKKDVAEIPRIDVRPANKADPTSQPVVVVIPGKSGNAPVTTVTVPVEKREEKK